MAGKGDASPRYAIIQPVAQDSMRLKQHASQRWSLDQNRSFLWMILSLFSGIALSVGHHFFYARFDGLLVGEVPIDQTWIIRIGTIFAFAAKTLLVIAASAAFIQQQWLALSRNEFKIRQIDTMTGVLGNAFSLFASRIWFRFPLLALMAGVTWLLPIAAVVTPATITVVPTEINTNIHSTPPQLYWDPTQYANLWTQARLEYTSPSPDTLRTAYGSAMTSQILSIPQAYPNMTYSLHFLGPALRCDHADDALIKDVYDSYMKYLARGVENQYRYIAWAPASHDRANLSFATGNEFDPLDIESSDAAHIYIIPNTSVAGPIYIGGAPIGGKDEHYGYQDLLDCKLYNASYETSFNFTFPTQKIDIQSRELLNPVNVSKDISEWFRSSGSPDDVARQAQRISYQAIMESFGQLVVGYEWWRDGVVNTEKTSWNMMAINWTERESTRTGLESLFQNITLSMLATPSLTMNTSIADRNRVPVNVITSENIYSYDPRDLWLAYGIACGASLLCALLGLYGVWRNGGVSYQNLFSTFVRTTREDSLRNLVEPHDRGSEPLPRKFAEAKIVLAT